MKQNRVFVTNCQLINLNMPPFALYGPTHMARHTFATYLINKDIPIESISKALGHTNTKQTLRYAHLLGKKIINDMKKLL